MPASPQTSKPTPMATHPWITKAKAIPTPIAEIERCVGIGRIRLAKRTMKLTRFEKRLLSHIYKTYPIPYEKPVPGSISILTPKTRPVATWQSLVDKFDPNGSVKLRESLDRLESYQLIKKLLLYSDADKITVHTGVGQPIQLANPSRNHTYGYQATVHGKDYMAHSIARWVSGVLADSMKQLMGQSFTWILLALLAAFGGLATWNYIMKIIK
jgi:hypothetical protein